MDHAGRHKLLDAINGHFRTYFESAQERFPSALVMLSRGESLSSVREIARIKPDLLKAIRNLKQPDVADLFKGQTQEDDYSHERLRHRYLLYRDVPDRLLIQRENLRRTGYVIMGHAQEARRDEGYGFQGYLARTLLGDVALHRSSNYMSHIRSVFENARIIAEIQAHALGFDTAYDACLEDFTPGVTCQEYNTLLETLWDKAVSVRKDVLEVQTEDTIALPNFSEEQGQKLVDLICDLIPIDDPDYQTHMLKGIPSMCMGNIATVRFSPNPLVLAETTIHERLGHLAYRYQADKAGGINGFHMDEARALSLERFFMREPDVLKQVSGILAEAYGKQHDAFDVHNLMKATKRVKEDISDRTSSDDITYIIQEIIRGKTEMNVMNGDLKVDDMPDYMAAETEKAFGLSDLNGYHIMRETFQWPLCMQGHVASYPQGFTIAANLHAAAKKVLGDTLSDISQGVDSPYFDFMRECVDQKGDRQSAQDISFEATNNDLLDATEALRLLERKVKPVSLQPNLQP